MRFARKKPDSEILAQNLAYKKGGDNTAISAILKTEQHNFCAYTECFLTKQDCPQIEHFYPKTAYPQYDHYEYWHLAIGSLNLKKPKKIEPYLPILAPKDAEGRIIYNPETNQFETIQAVDKEAQNLIDFLGLNSEWLCQQREDNRAALEDIAAVLDIAEYLIRNPPQISGVSVLEAVFNISLYDRLTTNSHTTP